MKLINTKTKKKEKKFCNEKKEEKKAEILRKESKKVRK